MDGSEPEFAPLALADGDARVLADADLRQLGAGRARTKLAMASLSLYAAAAAGGIFVMVDHAAAFGGLIMISSEPLQNALFVMAAGG